jgi:hypothetical protein
MSTRAAAQTKKSTKSSSDPVVIQLEQSQRAQVSTELAQVSKLAIAAANALNNEIVTADDLRLVTEMLEGPIPKALDRAEEIFGPMQKAANAAVAAIRKQRKEIEGPVLDAKNTLRAALQNYEIRRMKAAEEAAALERKRMLEEAKLITLGPPKKDPLSSLYEDEDEDGDPILDSDLILSEPRQVELLPQVEGGGVSFRDNWGYTVIEAGNLKADFMIPDHDKIAKAVRAIGEMAIGLISKDPAAPAISVVNRPIPVVKRS